MLVHLCHIVKIIWVQVVYIYILQFASDSDRFIEIDIFFCLTVAAYTSSLIEWWVWNLWQSSYLFFGSSHLVELLVTKNVLAQRGKTTTQSQFLLLESPTHRCGKPKKKTNAWSFIITQELALQRTQAHYQNQHQH